MNIYKFETNYKKKLFWKKTDNIDIKEYSPNVEFEVINIYPEIEYQSFIGFGGAFTESTGYSINLLPNELQESLLNDYFSNEGLCYSLCRLPIGSSDFSPSSYSYSQKEDLSDFSIEKDYQYIIPYVKKAQEINNFIEFLASPWSPPSFMKDNNNLLNGGKLKDIFKPIYADYIAKYIKAYKNEQILIKYLTPQNEPNAIQSWESCNFSAKEEIDFITEYLYPILKSNQLDTKILMWDHNKDQILKRVLEENSFNKDFNEIAGFAFHWYTGDHFQNLKILHDLYPNKLLIHSEGCTGYSHFKKWDEIKNAEIYAHDIIGDLNSGVNGYIDWNLVLDNKGGPNHKQNYCNSPIMINKKHSNYIKNLTYYYIGHFSKFIQKDSKRIAFSSYTDKLQILSFKNKDNSITVVLLNCTKKCVSYNLVINEIVINDKIDKHSIITYQINL